MKKIVGGVTTQHLVDDLNPTGYPQVVEELTNGAVSRTYTYGLQRISEDQVVNSAWTPSFYGYDGGGNVRQLTSSTGAVTDSYDYDAFGNKINSTGSTPNNYLYRGEQYDPDLGLYYLRARYYNPPSGRFMSRDPDEPKLRDSNGMPLDARILHKYLYANGDPVNRVDPTGREGYEEDSEEQGFSSTSALEAARVLRPYAPLKAYGICGSILLLWRFEYPDASLDAEWAYFQYCVASLVAGS